MTTKVKPSVLADTTVTAGTYGGSTQHAVFSVDAQGRLTYAGNATPSIATTQLTGTINATQIANNQTYGISVSGNAGTVTNGVYTSGSYSDPSWLTLSKSKVGLGNVDNTADANKSVSYATTSGNGGVTSVNGLTGAVTINVVGVGQTWSNVTSSRAYGTTYTNSTGKPIMVNVTCSFPTPGIGHIVSATVAGVIVGYTNINVVNGGGGLVPISFIVPAGSNYVVTLVSGSSTINYWAELR